VGRPVLFRAGARRDAHRALGVAAAPAPRVGIDPLLTAEEVAGLLQVSTAWVYAQTRAKRIPHVPLGRYVRYRRTAVIEWIADARAAIEQRSSSSDRGGLGDGG